MEAFFYGIYLPRDDSLYVKLIIFSFQYFKLFAYSNLEIRLNPTLYTWLYPYTA